MFTRKTYKFYDYGDAFYDEPPQMCLVWNFWECFDAGINMNIDLQDIVTERIYARLRDYV